MKRKKKVPNCVHIVHSVLYLKVEKYIYTYVHYYKCIKISGRLSKKSLTMIFPLERKNGVSRVKKLQSIYFSTFNFFKPYTCIVLIINNVVTRLHQLKEDAY